MWATAFLTGLSLSLPLSSTLIAARFFDGRFKSPGLSYAFTSFFAATFLGTKLAVAVIGRFLVSSARRNRTTPVPVRWALSGVSVTVLLMVLTLLQEQFEGYWLFGLILTLSVALATLTSFTESGALSKLSAFPPQTTQAVFLGQGVAGIWTATISLLFQVVLPSWLAPHFAIVNYTIAFFVVTYCAFQWHHLDSIKKATIESDAASVEDNEPVSSDAESQTTTISIPQTPTSSIATKIPLQIITVLLSNILSMTMFPFMVNKTQSVTLSAATFHPLAFFVSNLADMVGRLVPGWIPTARRHPRAILAVSLTRVLVFLALLTGNLIIDGHQLSISLYQSDTVFFVALMVSGVVHGAATTMSAMQTPFMVDPEEQGQAAALLGQCGMGGSFTGCLVALSLAYALKLYAM